MALNTPINLDDYDLVIFGDFNVLSNTPFKELDKKLRMLPGRVEYLAWVQEDRRQRLGTPLYFAVAGNKGGVPWGKQTEAQAEEELRWTAEQIGSIHYAVCFACPTCAPGFESYTTPEMLARRKPEPAMFRELAERLEVPFARVLIIDHYQDGNLAAKVLGMGYQPPSVFFRDAERYVTTATSTGKEKEPPEDFDPFRVHGGIL